MPDTDRESPNRPFVIQVAVELKTFIKVAIVLFIVFVVATFLGVKRTERPDFCATCKIMVPYYEAWKNSSHNQVPCIECHYAPGIRSTVEGKFKAISQVAKYVTATEGTRPWAEIPDESCLREECHERRLLRSKVKYGNVVFDHRPHLLDMRRGKQLQCTSCHSQMVMGSHISVTQSTCFICHFKDKSMPKLWGSCLDCHPDPKSKIKVAGGAEFPHKDYIDRNVPCMKCHTNVVQGDGAVPRERCLSCHNEERHSREYDNPSKVHTIHVTEHKVECFDCHLEIQHGLHRAQVREMPSCDTCHMNTHQAQLELYNGTGGRRVQPHTSEMAARQVSCRACHIVQPDKNGASFPGSTLIAENIACMACHGPEYKDILGNWQRTLDGLIAQTQRDAQAARAARPGWQLNDTEKLLAEQLLKDADFNLDFVRGAKGAHNIHYARTLLEKSQSIYKGLLKPENLHLLAKVDKKTRPKAVSRDTNCTKLCHTAPPDKTIRYYDKDFPHGKHGPGNKVACSQCHSTDKHGETTLSPESCNTCHHTQEPAKDCYACHKDSMRKQIGNFPHLKHYSSNGVACATCHKLSGASGTMNIQRDCASCHHVTGAARCASCHTASVTTSRGASFPHKKHATDYKVKCTQCHVFSEKRAKMVFTRNCVDCHHEPRGNTCAACHAAPAALTAKSEMNYDCDFCHKAGKGGGFADPWADCGKCHSQQIREEAAVHGARSCAKCHPLHSWSAKGAAACAACHKKVKHKQAVGGDCFECHKPHVWKSAAPAAR
jgi:nitrate/TMAO reductase-like tetraheme cytochrome c subunit